MLALASRSNPHAHLQRDGAEHDELLMVLLVPQKCVDASTRTSNDIVGEPWRRPMLIFSVSSKSAGALAMSAATGSEAQKLTVGAIALSTANG